MDVLAIIPARKGSKTIKNKNIRLINGKPLFAFSIEQALNSKFISRTIVSTDSPKYAKLAEQYGAEVPFLRPDEISGDYSTDLEVFQHALLWLRENENYVPEICVHLRPTHPIRSVVDIDNMIQILINNSKIDAVRSVVPVLHTPYKMWFRNDDGLINPILKCEVAEAYNAPRQSLPDVYLQNANIDVVRTDVILHKNSMTGDTIYGYVMDRIFDIDTMDDLYEARRYYKSRGKINE
ncbi:MAG: cytidylyltransferase domain-containing protein [Candidatus Zhuqueibacterota bacterium]